MSDDVANEGAANASEGPPDWVGYTVGGTDVHGARIKDVLHVSAACAVYITDDDSLGWHADDAFCTDPSSSAAEANELLTELKAAIGTKSVVRRGIRIIGGELARAFFQRGAHPTYDFFQRGREFIEGRRRESLHIKYVVAAFVTTIVLASVCTVIGAAVGTGSVFYLAAALGSGGSFVSVAHRFRSIPIERFSSGIYTVIAGVSRAILGAQFGALLVLFQKAGLLLSVAADHPYLLFAAAFVAGFSERLIPDVLERLEKSVSGRGDGKTA
jgi:hypothetical protein